ncbi:hypothetical protein JCM10914A_25410 [Paenibacillus sp. JCM 10914]
MRRFYVTLVVGALSPFGNAGIIVQKTVELLRALVELLPAKSAVPSGFAGM